jgi:hypothetical protein
VDLLPIEGIVFASSLHLRGRSLDIYGKYKEHYNLSNNLLKLVESSKIQMSSALWVLVLTPQKGGR